MSVSKDREKLEPHALLVRMNNGVAALENSFPVTQNVNQAIPLLSIYPRGMKTYVHTKPCKHMFIAALFIITQIFINGWLNNRMWDIHRMKYYWAKKKEWNIDQCYNMTEPWKHYANERSQ